MAFDLKEELSKKLHNQIMKLKLIVFAFVFFFNSSLYSQNTNRLEIIKYSHTVGYVNYFDRENTKSMLNNRKGFTLNYIEYKENNLSYGVSYNYNSSNLHRPITIGVFTVPANKNFFMNTFDVHVGYCFNIYKNITLETYSGITETTIVFYNNDDGKSKEYHKTGIPIGFRINWNINLNFKSDYFFVVFVNNNLNFNRLNKLNSNLDSFGYITEFGLGIMKEKLVIKSRTDRKTRR